MVNKMGAKNLSKNPFIFGASIGILVVLFNISIASLAEGSFEQGYQVFLDNGIFVILSGISVLLSFEKSENIDGVESQVIL